MPYGPECLRLLRRNGYYVDSKHFNQDTGCASRIGCPSDYEVQVGMIAVEHHSSPLLDLEPLPCQAVLSRAIVPGRLTRIEVQI